MDGASLGTSFSGSHRSSNCCSASRSCSWQLDSASVREFMESFAAATHFRESTGDVSVQIGCITQDRVTWRLRFHLPAMSARTQQTALTHSCLDQGTQAHMTTSDHQQARRKPRFSKDVSKDRALRQRRQGRDTAPSRRRATHSFNTTTSLCLGEHASL